ncbi:hypothetical protein BCT55_06545 [Vibrio splendidus]|uniref:Uncharacterized protein n=1 Tax=Vibrio splendidus TaxID=29497 RepID=A0A2T5EDN8_VIBSP|nr:hypothetical protein [Vibrio splendidus]OEE68921.1 hypothetical protein A147_00245 [Vibrio splendidus FF-6]PMM38222.1 hypothetical protein BCT55_06545 [Vibrio splendidus]PTP17452.1 hypothetical protein CWO36_17245 [Vibrio splendidus]
MDSNTFIGLVIGAIISYLIPKISPYIDSKLEKLGGVVRDKCFAPIKGFFRRRRLKKLRHLRVTRKNSSAVTFKIVTAHIYFLLFWGVIFFYVHLLIQTDYAKLLESNFWLGMFLATPIYCFEFAWLRADGHAKELVKQRGRLGL